ncbi:MAG TPA: AAA family ATPase [Candidatus Limnocylindrales bacterium]|nr:AAA family ATPase [Candidatus Limnocylindrales bacterium]
MSSASQIRLLLVEDVPQVAQYVRDLLSAQQQVRILDVLTDGRRVAEQVSQLRPDVLMVDALLQGKVRGLQVAEQVRRSGVPIPIVVVTVPQNPVEIDQARGVDHVLKMPFSGYELINLLQQAVAAWEATSVQARSKVVSVFASKGGVGRTTLAFNLAVALHQGGEPTVLVDGSFQFADLRALLKVPLDAPSILDLPTDRIAEGDLSEVLWRDPSGIDILLAPPRPEMAEMVTTRDVDKVLSLLRRVYRYVLIDTPSGLSDVVLTFLDQSDVILQIVNAEYPTLHNARATREMFKAIGYSAAKLEYLLNRADSGGIDPAQVEQVLGKAPVHSVSSDGRLVVEANNQGMPFVLTDPAAAVSRDIGRIATSLTGAEGKVAAGARR